MRVIADLVVNHTSDKHPWFKAARARPELEVPRLLRLVRRRRRRSAQAEPTFPDQETSVWTFDEKAGQYYLHRFYKHQPDLNVANPLVRDEIAKIMGFWVQLGLSGFRVDAVPFFLETMGVPGGEEALPDPHEYLRDLRSLLNRRVGDAILLGEVNLSHKDQLQFFGGPEGDELHMQFDFIGMQRLYLSLARADFAPAGRGPADPAAAPAGEPVGQLRPQPRRADPGQAERGRAAGGVRRVRARAGDAGLRPRADPPAAADARRRPAPDQDGLQPAVLPARHPGAVLRRGDRHGREPGRRGPAGGADADAVVAGQERRVLQRARRTGCPGSRRRARTGRSSSTSPTSSATRTRCSTSSARWRPPTATARSSAGARARSSSSRTPAVLAHRSTWDDGSVVALHNASAEPVTVPAHAGRPGARHRAGRPAGRRHGRARREGPGGADPGRRTATAGSGSHRPAPAASADRALSRYPRSPLASA